jgi:(S)-2-hydroxyglutarate dehydrogenase
MPDPDSRTVAVVGGGILGAAVARQLALEGLAGRVVLLEKESALARHQTGRNSGVVHAGLYYEPGSLKATLCRRGVGMLREFCREHAVAYDEIGKVLVALDDEEVARLAGIEQRALANGVPGVRRISAGELRELEPHVAGVGGLHSPTTAIVDYPAMTRALAADLVAAGGEVRLSTRVVGLREVAGGVVVDAEGPTGPTRERVAHVVVCAGLQADLLARGTGGPASPRIVPFRGEYHVLRPERQHLVRGLVYPVPDPRYPFLGVHLTPRVDGQVLVGPNAVLALAREGYDWGAVSPRELVSLAGHAGFRRFARQHWRTGVTEVAGSLSRRRFAAAARRYLPELRTADLVPGPAGVRAQAMEDDGSLVDDFRIDRGSRVTSLRNAPSPAATSSLAIAEHVVAQVRDTITGGHP